DLRKAWWMSSRRSQRVRSRRNWCSQPIVRSMGQRWRPRPEPWGWPRRDDRGDLAGGEPAAVGVVVVGPVREQIMGAPSWPTSAAADQRDRLDERQELGDVVAVAAGHEGRERDTCGVGDHMVFAAGVRPVDRARTRLGPPFNA